MLNFSPKNPILSQRNLLTFKMIKQSKAFCEQNMYVLKLKFQIGLLNFTLKTNKTQWT